MEENWKDLLASFFKCLIVIVFETWWDIYAFKG